AKFHGVLKSTAIGENSSPVCSQLQIPPPKSRGENRRSALSAPVSVCDVRGSLETRLVTKVKSEPEGVRSARNHCRTGAGEIVRVKVKPTFVTLLDGPAKLM